MKPKIYASKSMEKYFQREINKRFIVKSKLNIKCVPNGVIAVGQKDNSFGVFDDKGVLIKESLLWRRKRIGQGIPPADATIDAHYFDYDAVYLGDLSYTFGHHLIENWDRAYAFLDEKYKNCKCVLVNDKYLKNNQLPIPNFVKELARFLKISTENLVILNESAKFRNVYVPEQGFMAAEFSTKEFGELYDKTTDNVKEKFAFDKIYVSRTALGLRKTHGEEKIQQIFENNGYYIMYPEKLPLEEQISLMKTCKSLAGCAGTALHLALFMPRGGNVIQIKRNKKKADNFGIQWLITETKEQNLTIIEASIEKNKTNHYDENAQIIDITKYMKRFFDDNDFNYSQDDLEFDKKAYEEYLLANKKIAMKLGSSRLKRLFLGRILTWICFFIPNRQRRKNFREKMKKTWNLI